ncbi:MAG: MFS transporter [Betaproteobacteria bacterium]|nr:MFS transporter [Betaproteobacteria bacterium]
MNAPATRAGRRHLAAWVGYDMALHGYALMIPAVGFALYFTSFVAAGEGQASVLWSMAVAIPLVAAGLLAPLLGALADARGRHRALLATATLACAAATAALAIPGQGAVGAAIATFTVAHLAFLLAGGLYNAYLPKLSESGNVARISGLGWGLSYLGSIACLLICLPFVAGGIAPGGEGRYALAFVVTAAFVAAVGLPAALALPATQPDDAGQGNPYRRIADSVRSWRGRPQVPRFLLGYYLINDAVVTVVYFTGIFLRDTFGLSVQEVLWYSLAFQLVAIPATLVFGWLGDRWGQQRALLLSLAIWAIVLLLMAFASGAWAPLAIVGCLGLVLGSTQSLCRSLFVRLFPSDRAGEYFGFHALAGRASSALGPLLFGVVALLTGSQRVAMASLALFLAVGGWLLLSVRIDRAMVK